MRPDAHVNVRSCAALHSFRHETFVPNIFKTSNQVFYETLYSGEADHSFFDLGLNEKFKVDLSRNKNRCEKR